MNNLDILQNLLDDLKERKMRYILIPCPLSVHAEILMTALDSKDIRWMDNGDVLQAPATRWSRYKTDTLYAISCSSKDNFEVERGDLDAIKRVSDAGIKHVVVHVYGIIGVESAFEALRYDGHF
jgi:hypothetical protein